MLKLSTRSKSVWKKYQPRMSRLTPKYSWQAVEISNYRVALLLKKNIYVLCILNLVVWYFRKKQYAWMHIQALLQNILSGFIYKRSSCCCSSQDSLKLGFRCTRWLVVGFDWPITRLESFAHSCMYSMLHFKLTNNSRGSYSMITSPWPYWVTKVFHFKPP